MATTDYDVLIIGSGFGGSVSALRLTEKGYRVGVLEQGRRWTPEELPETTWDVRRYLWRPEVGLRGFLRMTLLRDVVVLSQAAVGGGSIGYACTLYRPADAFYTDRQWAHISDWEDELAPHFDRAERMLGVTDTPWETPADRVMRRVAERMRVADTFRPTPVGIWFGEPGVRAADPYFGGEGPPVSGCVACGGCMVGCRYEAKNTLDRNYLYLAERHGAVVHPEREVTGIRPLGGGGYRVVTRRPGALVDQDIEAFTAEQVVLSAGVLGTLRLLFDMRAQGALPEVSPALGQLLRTNSEALLGVVAKGTEVDYSEGNAITSSLHPDEFTHVEPVRYSPGSNMMGLLATVLTPGDWPVPRAVRWLYEVVRHPVRFLRSLSVRHWAQRTIIVLVMQSLDNSLVARRTRSGRLTTRQGHGDPNPPYIPLGYEAVRHAEDVVDGVGGTTWNEALLGIPMTAHIIGGATIGDSPRTGVVDPYHRVFGHPGLHIVDGSVITANLGANPSLTITALAERALSMWPNRGDPDPRPPIGAAYERVDPVAARSPAVPEDAPAALVSDRGAAGHAR